MILRNAAQAVDLPADKLQKIIEEMRRTLIIQKDPEGVGLAANQVGLPYRLFLARFDTRKNSPVHVFINPEILEHSEELVHDDHKGPLEGCLSLPKYYGVVKRYQWVDLKYFELTSHQNLEPRTSRFEDFPATVIQHEMDHLNGKIFVERILEQKGKLYKVLSKKGKSAKGRSASGGEDWEEIEL